MSKRSRQITGSEAELRAQLQQRSRRSFLIGGAAALTGIGSYAWLRTTGQDNQTPWPERRVLDFNGRLAKAYVGDNHHIKTYQPKDVAYLKPNGDLGLDDDLDSGAWRLHVKTGGSHPDLKLTLADVMALPKQQMITPLCCIEGWSVVTQWGGARLADFTRKYLPPGRPLPQYVGMNTPDEEYYVGLDMKSALHPQTLLAWEMNGKPLTEEHGAPLRLVIPAKYGIKNLKRLGLIEYTDERPTDYWFEQGYDWFAGL